MISRLRYTMREMWASLTRNLTLTVAAVITSMVSLFLFGMTLLIQQAFDNQLSQWTGGVKMIVYVKNGAPDDAVSTIQEALESRPEIIKNVEYCSIDCSLSQAKKLFAADPESLKFLSAENIPSYFSVEPVDKQSIEQLLSIRQSFVALPGVLRADFPSDQITVLGKRKNESGGSREGRRRLGADLKRPSARGARSHDVEWGGCGMWPGRAVPRSAG